MNANITVKVKIIWSENGYVESKVAALVKEFEKTQEVNGFLPVADVNQILKVATWDLLNKHGSDYGYDKTKFELVVIDHDDSDKEHTYGGRIDLGTDTEGHIFIVQDHIIDWLEYCMSDKADTYSKVSDPEQKLECLKWCLWMNRSKQDEIANDRLQLEKAGLV